MPFLITKHGVKLGEAGVVFRDTERLAIDEAMRLSVRNDDCFDVYELREIGTSTSPVSKFMDTRPQVVKEGA